MHSTFRIACLWLATSCLCLTSLCVSVNSLQAREPHPDRLQVFILAGQSNMVGHANFITIPRLSVDSRPEVQQLANLVFKDGQSVSPALIDQQIATRIAQDTLRQDLRNKKIEGAEQIAAAQAELQRLQAVYDKLTAEIKQAFAVSESVYITSIADHNIRSGPLTVGFGANPEKIGPELGFGMSMATRLKSPVLIIKTSWGGKSLNYNFRPPSSGPYVLTAKEQASENADQIQKDASLNYRLMIEQVETVLGDLKAHHPGYNPDSGYDLAGFVWFQGFNDQFSDEFRDSYKDNMINFVKDIRTQYDAPDLPFVIGVLGTGITAEKVGQNAVSVAQRAAAAMPEFKDNVASVESYTLFDLEALEVFERGWKENFAEWCTVGSDRPYHYLGSGKFFVRFGDALAASMADLIEKQ
jgi:alpha-galactosidase